jgi:hypothetical protein
LEVYTANERTSGPSEAGSLAFVDQDPQVAQVEPEVVGAVGAAGVFLPGLPPATISRSISLNSDFCIHPLRAIVSTRTTVARAGHLGFSLLPEIQALPGMTTRLEEILLDFSTRLS